MFFFIPSTGLEGWRRKVVHVILDLLCCPCLVCLVVFSICRPSDRKYSKHRAREAKPWDPIPRWPKERSRRLSLPLPMPVPIFTQQASIRQPGLFFSRLPLELRRRVYEYALGGDVVHLVILNGKLRSQICSEAPDCWCKKTDFYTKDDFDVKRCEDTSRLGLILSCRSVYTEAINILYSANTFIIPHQPRQSAVPWALLFLPYFILPQRFRHIQRLHVVWYACHTYPTSYLREVPFQFPLIEATDGWANCWKVLAAMKGLRELYIQFGCDEWDQKQWMEVEPSLLKGIREVSVRDEFIVVLPFQESNVHYDVGSSRCHLRLPDAINT